MLLLLFIFYRWGNWDTELWNNLTKVIQLVSDRFQSQKQGFRVWIWENSIPRRTTKNYYDTEGNVKPKYVPGFCMPLSQN